MATRLARTALSPASARSSSRMRSSSTSFHVAHPAPLPPAAPLARILPRVATSSSQPHHTDDTLQFIHVRGFLTPDEVAAMNAALDANMSLRSDFGPTNDALANTPLMGTHSVFRHWNDLLTMPQPHCLPFRELMAHPKLVPYLNALLGRGWKWDHGATIHSQEAGSEGLRLHGDGNAEFNGSRYYTYNNGRMRCGLVNCQWFINDQRAGDGGLVRTPRRSTVVPQGRSR